jgi:hypothetical protein
MHIYLCLNIFTKKNSLDMVSINNLPIVILTEDNIKNEWHNLIDHLKTSTFISIDIVIIKI